MRSLDVLPVDPDRPGAELPPVPDEVVGLAQSGSGIALDQVLVPRGDPGERVVAERPAPGLLVELEEREVDDPEELVAALVDEAELAPEVQSRRNPSTRATRRGSSATNSTVDPGSARRASSSRSERNFAIGDRTSPRLVDDEVRETLRPPLLRELLEPLELGPRERLAARRRTARTARSRTRRTRSRA